VAVRVTWPIRSRGPSGHVAFRVAWPTRSRGLQSQVANQVTWSESRDDAGAVLLPRGGVCAPLQLRTNYGHLIPPAPPPPPRPRPTFALHTLARCCSCRASPTRSTTIASPPPTSPPRTRTAATPEPPWGCRGGGLRGGRRCWPASTAGAARAARARAAHARRTRAQARRYPRAWYKTGRMSVQKNKRTIIGYKYWGNLFQVKSYTGASLIS
jgi:hypothetical protein